MNCPECDKEFEIKTNYNPTTQKNDLPYYTYSHLYALEQLMDNPKLCKRTIRIDIKINENVGKKIRTFDELDEKVKQFALKLYREKGIKVTCERCFYLIDPKCPDYPHICDKETLSVEI